MDTEKQILTVDEIAKKFLTVRKELLKYCNKLTSNIHDAEDLLSEVSIKILTNRDKFDPDTNFRAWAYSITKRLFIDKYRGSKGKQTVDYESYLDVKKTDNDGPASFVREDINNALANMEEKAREMICLFLDGYKYEELAEHFKIPMGTVKSHLNKYKKQMMVQLKDYEKARRD